MITCLKTEVKKSFVKRNKSGFVILVYPVLMAVPAWRFHCPRSARGCGAVEVRCSLVPLVIVIKPVVNNVLINITIQRAEETTNKGAQPRLVTLYSDEYTPLFPAEKDPTSLWT